MRRILATIVVGVAAWVIAAPAGSAHEEITPSTVTVDTPTFLTLTAANEAQSDLVNVSLEAPESAPFGETTRAPAGWTAEVSQSKLTFSGGAIKPESFDSF